MKFNVNMKAKINNIYLHVRVICSFFTVGLRFKVLLPFGTRRRKMITKKMKRKFIVYFKLKAI